MKEELGDPCSVPVKVVLRIDNGPVSTLPNLVSVKRFLWEFLTLQNFGMNANDENFLVIGTIENPDSPALRKASGRAPEKIVFQVFDAGLLETKNLAAL